VEREIAIRRVLYVAKCALIVPVPHVEAAIGQAQRTKNHKVLLTTGQIHSGDACDGNQCTAGSEDRAGRQAPVSTGDLGSRDASVFGPNAGIESVEGVFIVAHSEVDLDHGKATNTLNGEQLRYDRRRSGGFRAGDRISDAIIVNGAPGGPKSLNKMVSAIAGRPHAHSASTGISSELNCFNLNEIHRRSRSDMNRK